MSKKEKEITTAEKVMALFIHLKDTTPNDKEFGTKVRTILDKLLEN